MKKLGACVAILITSLMIIFPVYAQSAGFDAIIQPDELTKLTDSTFDTFIVDPNDSCAPNTGDGWSYTGEFGYIDIGYFDFFPTEGGHMMVKIDNNPSALLIENSSTDGTVQKHQDFSRKNGTHIVEITNLAYGPVCLDYLKIGNWHYIYLPLLQGTITKP